MLIICLPGVKHVWKFKEVISNIYSKMRLCFIFTYITENVRLLSLPCDWVVFKVALENVKVDFWESMIILDYYGFEDKHKFHILLASSSHNRQVLATNRPSIH
jgi:hypothetical protein